MTDRHELKRRIEEAYTRISEVIKKTPLIISKSLSNERSKAYLKCENQQLTGSFKIRGALNKIAGLSAAQRLKGVIAASTGNHGLAVTLAMQKYEGSGIICLPKNALESKIAKLEKNGATIEFMGEDSGITEILAREKAIREDLTYISPYNDVEIIAGQGTIGVEIVEDLPQIDYLFATVGGGGLISGVGSYIKSVNPNCKIIACQPINSAIMHDSIQAGEIIQKESLPTLSDGSAGGIEKESITFEIVKSIVDEFVLVEEEEIAQAIQLIYHEQNMEIEGAAGVAVAAYIKMRSQINGNAVIILCGKNIDPKVLTNIITEK